jgi:hypothetical protein
MKSSTKCDGLGRDEVTDTLGDEGDVERDNVQVTGEARSCGWAPDTALIEAITASFNDAIREKPRPGWEKIDWQRSMFVRNMISRSTRAWSSLRALDETFDRMVSYLSLRDEDESGEPGEGRCMTNEAAAALCSSLGPPRPGDPLMTQEDVDRLAEVVRADGARCGIVVGPMSSTELIQAIIAAKELHDAWLGPMARGPGDSNT